MAGLDLESISVTLPGDGRYTTVARIVVGGLAARHHLSYENLDDLQLAVEAVLGEPDMAAGREITLELTVHDGAVVAELGPVHAPVLERALALETELGLRVVLGAVVESVELGERDGAPWLRLEKRIPVLPGD